MEIIKKLAAQVQEINAGVGHMKLENIEKTQGLTAVISVYDNQKPAHMVLDELYEWAEENNAEVKALIEKLEQDMSWNSKMGQGEVREG